MAKTRQFFVDRSSFHLLPSPFRVLLDPSRRDRGRKGILTEVANSSPITRKQRVAYYEALTNIYRNLPNDPVEACRDANTLCVGIEREGRMLAEAIGCLPEGRGLRPHAKRVPFEGGLEIGIKGIPELPQYTNCVIIDGAIASGATLIAVMSSLRKAASSFRIYSAHATREGLRAISRYSSLEGLDVDITVGHATSGINDHFYATFPDAPDKVVVGDLGDTISDLK